MCLVLLLRLLQRRRHTLLQLLRHLLQLRVGAEEGRNKLSLAATVSYDQQAVQVVPLMQALLKQGDCAVRD